MKEIAMMAQEKDSRVYVMYNKANGVKIECNKKYVIDWIARGFEVLEVRDESFSGELGKLSMDGNTNN